VRSLRAILPQQTWDEAEGLPTIIQDGTTKEITGPGGLPLEQVSGSGVAGYFIQDQLGSTRGRLDSSGIDTPFRYAGQYTDSESGLIYLRTQYDPASMQFLPVDPLASQTGEPYGYVAGDPVNQVDSSGNCSAQARGPRQYTLLSGSKCRITFGDVERHTPDTLWHFNIIIDTWKQKTPQAPDHWADFQKMHVRYDTTLSEWEVYGRRPGRNSTPLPGFFNAQPQSNSPADESLVTAMGQLENAILAKYGRTCNLLEGPDRQAFLDVFSNAWIPGSVGWKLRSELFETWQNSQ
jgi:RHS repeat-associated protein